VDEAEVRDGRSVDGLEEERGGIYCVEGDALGAEMKVFLVSLCLCIEFGEMQSKSEGEIKVHMIVLGIRYGR
jgi:hypothetical protein